MPERERSHIMICYLRDVHKQMAPPSLYLGPRSIYVSQSSVNVDSNSCHGRALISFGHPLSLAVKNRRSVGCAEFAARRRTFDIPLQSTLVKTTARISSRMNSGDGSIPIANTSIDQSHPTNVVNQQAESNEVDESITGQSSSSNAATADEQASDSGQTSASISREYLQSSPSIGNLDTSGVRSSDSSEGDTMAGKNVAAKLGQSFNPAGIGFFIRLLSGNRHWALPHMSVPDIRWIDWAGLRAAGFHGAVLDKDNTITLPYAKEVWPDLVQPLKDCQLAFEGRVAILSNSAGLQQFDPNGEEADALEALLGVPVIRHSSKKPAGDAEALIAHFGCEPSKLIMVGDRFFTDVVFGNRHGLLTIRPAPLSTHREPFVVRQVRAFEDFLVDGWQKDATLDPPPHPLAPTPSKFVKDPGCW